MPDTLSTPDATTGLTRRRVHRKGRRKLVAILLGILFGCASAELLLRASGYYPRALIPPYLYDNHPRTWWTLRPNFKGDVDTPQGPVEYRINAQGIRASHATLPGTRRRIFSIGDSFTFGWGVSQNTSFPALLENALRATDPSAEVLNLGVPGFGTMHAYERLLEYSEKLGRPAIVIYMFTPNDPVDNIAGHKTVVDGIRMDTNQNHKHLLSRIAYAYYRSRLVALFLDFYYRHFADPRAAATRKPITPTSVDDRPELQSTMDYLLRMAQWAENNSVKLLVVATSRSEYSSILKESLAARGLPFIEAEDFSKTMKDPEAVFLFDGHWNARGNRIVARGIHKFLTTSGWLGE